MPNAPILIVGAGPTGLVLALRLARHGVPFRLIDKNSGPGQASRAMVVQARTLEFYQQLGFADDVVAQGVRVAAVHLRETDKEVAKITFGDIGQDLSPFPFLLCYPQDDHERFLVGRLEAAGVNIEWNTELKDLSQDAAGVHVVLAKSEGDENGTFEYVCGCDGGHSRVRTANGIDFPGGSYDEMFYVADVRIEGGFRTDMFVNLGAHALGLLLPVRSSGMQRLLGVIPPGVTKREGLTYEDIRPVVEPLLAVHVTEVNWFSTYYVHHRVAAHFRAGRCFLAGDAGHVHSPAGAQGMNTGIGDAVNLAWKLASVVQGRADPAILDTYETERIAFARALVSTTDRAFRSIVDPGLIGRVLRTWLMPNVIPFLTGFTGGRRALFRAASQTRIAYPDSALSEGEAGEVSGGERLPWVPTPDGGNFAPLASLDWQVHVYGEAPPELTEAVRTRGLPLHVFPWTDATGDAGLKCDAGYLVRPDGYVALAAVRLGPDVLDAYMHKHGLRLAA